MLVELNMLCCLQCQVSCLSCGSWYTTTSMLQQLALSSAARGLCTVVLCKGDLQISSSAPIKPELSSRGSTCQVTNALYCLSSHGAISCAEVFRTSVGVYRHSPRLHGGYHQAPLSIKMTATVEIIEGVITPMILAPTSQIPTVLLFAST